MQIDKDTIDDTTTIKTKDSKKKKDKKDKKDKKSKRDKSEKSSKPLLIPSQQNLRVSFKRQKRKEIFKTRKSLKATQITQKG